MIMLCGCKSAVGYWQIKEIKAASVSMTQKDTKDLGIKLGYFKLRKSGKCNVCILDEESEGTWTEKDGEIVVEYDGHTAKGKKDGKKIVLEDEETAVYTLENNFG